MTFVSISRLYNLGNYQNVKYEIGAEVPDGQNATDVFKELRFIMAALKPIAKPDCIHEYRRALKETEESRSTYQKEHFTEWEEAIAAYTKRFELREQALKALDSLGGNALYRDAKNEWDDDPSDDGF